ncbi:MAG: hypothetical protein HQM10_13175 [Candidatus Riflebacteria bacterium]|nr:hypothetical protein [Candidatus Riflebacteria bacterium]
MISKDNYKLIRTSGFTIMEVIISSAILISLFSSVIWIFTSSGRSINRGSWQVQEQKGLQMFLDECSRDLNRASPAISTVASNGEMIFDPGNPQTPIAVNSKVFSTSAPKKAKLSTFAATDWKCLMSFCISRPYVEKNATMGITLNTPGEWTGISMWAKGSEIRYIRANDPNVWAATPKNLPAAIPPQYPSSSWGGVSSTGKFRPSKERIKDFIAARDVSEISITASGPPYSIMEIRLKLIRLENGKPAKPEQAIEQTISAALSTGTPIVTF